MNEWIGPSLCNRPSRWLPWNWYCALAPSQHREDSTLSIQIAIWREASRFGQQGFRVVPPMKNPVA
jgi:hypothetical protein